MRFFIITGAIAALAFGAVAPAFAEAQCDPHTEHKLTVLDWTLTASGKPDITKPLRVRTEACPVNTANSSLNLFQFRLLGDKLYPSRDQLNADLELVLNVLAARKQFGVERLGLMALEIEEDLGLTVANK